MSPAASGMRAIERQRTAIARSDLSRGARTPHEDQLLQGRAVLDYGCGRGDDVVGLRLAGVSAYGWDPHYFPTPAPSEHDVVLLTYVLNAIEDPTQRKDALRRAWSLTAELLVVTGRLTWERNKVPGEAYSDGVVTSRSTFQHLFAPSELVRLVGEVLGQQALLARPGVVYVFRSSSRRLAYLTQRYGLDHSGAVQDLQGALTFYETRGRPPELCDGITKSAASTYRAALKRVADPSRVESALRATTTSLLLFLAMERFHGKISWRSLTASMQADVIAAFGSYKHATWRAARLLGQLQDGVVLRRTMRASVGKTTPSALYVHRRALSRTPVLLRIYEECGALAAGRPPDWNVVKLHHDRSMVSWLRYPLFDKDPHPALASSYHADLATLRVGVTDYADAENPPVLHRKEEFLANDDPRVPTYQRLTAQEVRAGLYQHPDRIGTRLGWQSELDRRGRSLRGHRLINSMCGRPPAEQ